MTEEEKKEAARQRAKKHYELNKSSKKAYQEANKEKIIADKKRYFQENKKEFYEREKKYRKKNKELNIKIKLTRKQKDKRNKLIRIKKSSNPIFKLSCDIRSSIGKSFRNKGYSKIHRCNEILGCTFEEFKIYLESKFEPWMNWENRGLFNGEKNYGWDIDHIIPLSTAKTEDDVIKLNHYTNLQPLCSYTNRHIKKNK